MDYEAISDLVIDFQRGNGTTCHTINIEQDDLCEEPAETFLSHLAHEAGTLPINVVRTPATIHIIDSAELECSKLIFSLLDIIKPF